MGPKAPKGQTLAQAEQRALRGDVESQDSQLFLDQYHQKYAPGLRSSSPSVPLSPDAIDAQIQQYPRPAKVHQRFAGATAPASKSNSILEPKEKEKANPRGRMAKDKGQEQHTAGAGAGAVDRSGVARTTPAPDASAFHTRRASPTQPARHPSGRAILSQTVKQTGIEVEPVPVTGPQAIDDGQSNLQNESHASIGAANSSHLILASTDDDDGGNCRNAGPPTEVSARLATRRRAKTGLSKMETSQSPTQSNDGRSYEQYIPRGDDLAATSSMQESEPVLQPSEHTSNAYDENESFHDDTGAVNFDNIDRYDTDLTALDSTSTGKPAHGSPAQLRGEPETPAPPKNPFAGSKAHLLNGSQLFKQTQVSSACKAFSPTSSRPSPDNFQMQDSISPNIFISSPLKNRAGPSPFQGALSSPQFLPQIDTSPQQAQHEHVASDGDATSSTPFQPMRRLPKGPTESYRPVHKSQGRRQSLQADSDTASDEDASSDDEERRYHRATLKRLAAEKQLKSISYERPSTSEDVIVPSTNTRKEKSRRTDSQEYLDQCEGEVGEDSQDAVEDSQSIILQPEPIDAQQAVIDDSQAPILLPSQEHADDASSNVGVILDTLPNTAATTALSSLAADAENALNPPHGSNKPRHGDADAIPETSPAKLRPLGEMMPHSSDKVSKPGSFATLLDSGFQGSSLDRYENVPESRLPGIQSSASLPGERPARRSPDIDAHSPGSTACQTISESALPEGPAHPEAVAVVETSSVVGSSPPMPAARTRTRLRAKRAHVHSTSPEGLASTGSSLSVLTTTPTFSNKTTPLTDESPADRNLMPSSSNDPHTSPAAAKAGRRGIFGAVSRTKPGTTPQKNLRTSTRRSRASVPRKASLSTDELARSPSSSRPRAFEQSVMLPRFGRSSLREPPGSRENSRGGSAKILTGMAFAISFQARQSGEKDSHYNSRLGLSCKIADKIKQAGGKVLIEGFNELFEPSAIKKAEVASSTPLPDEEIKLTTAAKSIGFTALIADGHSRKVKYMQALALGLPCIHERWITTCVDQQRLVDWSDYLLCAGNSSFLGNAIRSRTLPSYDVASAKLSEVIKNRPRLLHGSRILLVLRKQDEDMNMAYVFLARVLGASLSRVYSMDEAKRQLKASEDAGHPYDWVYVEDKMAARVDFLSDGHHTVSSKKRKRKSEVASADSPPRKIRALSNELVIQSLILGRLLDEGEMNG